MGRLCTISTHLSCQHLLCIFEQVLVDLVLFLVEIFSIHLPTKEEVGEHIAVTQHLRAQRGGRDRRAVITAAEPQSSQIVQQLA